MKLLLASIAGLLLSIALGGCVTNSTGQYRGRAVAQGDPWPLLHQAWREGSEVAPSDVQAGLQQLEDLVEHAASRVFGGNVDFPTPELFCEDQLVSMVDRGPLTGGPRILHLEPWLEHADFWGLKFLLDHCATASLGDLSNAERDDVLRLCSAVGSFVRGSTSSHSARREVLRLQGVVFASLGLSEEVVRENELRFDSSIWQRSAYTQPGTSSSGPRVFLSNEVLREPGVSPAFAYAHELFHALVFSHRSDTGNGDPPLVDSGGNWIEAGWNAANRSEASLATHEQSAQVFAKRVVDELRRSRAMGEIEPVDFGALPGRGIEGGQAEQDRWQRLFSLYHSPPDRLASEGLIAARYGYDGDEEQLERIDRSMAAHGVQQLVERLARDMALQSSASTEPAISRRSPGH